MAESFQATEDHIYIGVDCGTQGTNAMLLRDDGTVLARGYARHALIEKPSGAREQDPSWWVAAMKTAVGEALSSLGDQERSQVRAIGVSGQQHGLVVLDESLQVIRPAKLWNDTETVTENEQLIRKMGGPSTFYERFGVLPRPGYTVSKLAWLAAHEPAHFARIRHILLPHEYLNFWLTGKFAAEFGDASGTGYFDPRTRTWVSEILASIDSGTGQLLAALPPLVEPTALLGTVRAEVAAEFGIPTSCSVSAGGGDNMMGAIGTGNVAPGVVTLSLGTSSTVYCYSDHCPKDATGNVASFCSSTGGWLPLVCTMNATNVVTQTVELLGKTVEDIDAALNASPPGADGLIFLPFLNGERTPNLPTARGSLHGISATNYKAENLIRAAVEGVSFGILNGLSMVLEGRRAERIRVIGGGAKSRAWRQLLADVTGAVVEVPLEEEAGCLGAAMQALVATEASVGRKVSFRELAKTFIRFDSDAMCKPNSELSEDYRAAFAAYNKQLAASHPLA